MYSKIKLTETEERFVDSFMGDTNIHPQHQLYFTMMKKFLLQYQADKAIIDHTAKSVSPLTTGALTICENILYKINMAEADAAIESILDGSMTGTVTKPNIKRAVRKNLTKAISYDHFMFTKGKTLGAKVLSFIQATPHVSRAQIANSLGIRLSSVCSIVNTLYKKNLIRVSGVTTDSDSEQTVETLEVRD